jgi:hypothetical protein
MVSRRKVLAGMLAGALVVVGGVVAVSRRKAGYAPPPLGSGKLTIPGAVHFPTSLESPAFSDMKMDALFTGMLAQMGVQLIAFEWDYQVFADPRWNGRLVSAYNDAKARGMKTHIINQIQPAFWKTGGIDPPPGSTSPSWSINAYEMEVVRAYAQLKPDFLSVIAEPANLQQKFKFSYSYPQWSSLVQKLVDEVSGSSTWVDLVPNAGFDINMVPSLVGISGLNGIGMDLYGSGNESVVESRLAAIADAGKSWGLSETWWGPLYSQPSLNTKQNEPLMASWFLESFQWAMKYGAVMYNPFFTNLFVQDPGQATSYTYSSLAAYFSEELSQLQRGSFTSIHDSYAELIRSLG